MAKELSTADRVVLLLALVPYLDEHGPTPVTELAEKFSVDERLLRRLVRFLGMAGVPGETLSYQHEDLFDIDWTALEEHDIVSLTRIIAVDDTPRFSSAEASALIAGLHLLVGLLPESERALALHTAEKLASATDADRVTTLSVTAEREDPRVAQLVTLLESGNRVGFSYRDASGLQSERSVEPLVMRQEAGVWYLRAYCLDREAERTFRLDRMDSLRALPERSERTQSSGGSVGAVSNGSLFRADDSASPVAIGIRLREGALLKFAEFAPLVLGPAERGWVRAIVQLGHIGLVSELVRVAPGEIVVETPEEARSLVKRWAEDALAQYNS